MFNFLRKLKKQEAISLEECLAQNGQPFESREKAEACFFGLRDAALQDLQAIAAANPELNLDKKGRSLERLEKFYFACYTDKAKQISISKERFEELMTQYMRQVFVHNEMAEWEVFENDFAEGRYELGLMYGYGAGSTERYGEELDAQKDNKERNFLYTQFMLYVPAEREDEVQ
jgi:hypothetical protein